MHSKSQRLQVYQKFLLQSTEELAQAGDLKWVDQWLEFLSKTPSSLPEATQTLRDLCGVVGSHTGRSGAKAFDPAVPGGEGLAASAAKPTEGEGEASGEIEQALKKVTAAPEEVKGETEQEIGWEQEKEWWQPSTYIPKSYIVSRFMSYIELKKGSTSTPY